MGRTSLESASVIAGLAAVCLLLAPSQTIVRAQSGHAHHQSATEKPWAEGDVFAGALAAGMDRMHRDMMAPLSTGNADVDFLATMIPHHEGAVEMARLILIPGRDPLVRQLAEEIIAGHVDEFSGWFTSARARREESALELRPAES